MIGSHLYNSHRLMLFGTPAVLMLIAALSLEPVLKGWLSSIFRYLGDASYSIYLVHMFVLLWVGRYWPENYVPLVLFPFLALPIAVGVALLFFELVERPLLNSIRRRAVAPPAGQFNPIK